MVKSAPPQAVAPKQTMTPQQDPTAQTARGTVAASPARLQARKRRATVDAESRALCCAGADAGPAGASVGNAGAIAADTEEVMRALNVLGPLTGSKSIR